MSTEKLMTTRALAERLGIAYPTARDWIRSNKIEHYKIGGYAVRISEKQLEAFLAKSLIPEMDLRETKW